MKLTQEQKLILQTVNQIAETEFLTNSLTWNGKIPWENIKLLADRNLLGININDQYGGGGMSEFEAMLVIDAIGRICPDTAYFVQNQQMVCSRVIDMFGSESTKEKYLPKLLSGDTTVATAISEPGAGSDIRAMNTRIDLVDGRLILNGEKTWVSLLPASSASIVWAKFPEGIGSVIIDLDREGIEILNHYKNMANHTQTHFVMNDVSIDENNILVRGENGFKRMLESLNWERLGEATLSNSWSRCALDHTFEYAKQREQFDRKLFEFQGIKWKIADMIKLLESASAITYQAALSANELDEPPNQLITSIAKLHSAETLDHVICEALQIHGANAYQQGHPIEYLYRMSRGRRLAGGTDEIQRNSIASAVERKGIPKSTAWLI